MVRSHALYPAGLRADERTILPFIGYKRHSPVNHLNHRVKQAPLGAASLLTARQPSKIPAQVSDGLQPGSVRDHAPVDSPPQQTAVRKQADEQASGRASKQARHTPPLSLVRFSHHPSNPDRQYSAVSFRAIQASHERTRPKHERCVQPASSPKTSKIRRSQQNPDLRYRY